METRNMKRAAKFKVNFDEAGDLRWYLIAGNGAELCRSHDSYFKRKNSERSIERLKTALQQISDEDIVDAIMEFRRAALAASIEPGPGRKRRAA